MTRSPSWVIMIIAVLAGVLGSMAVAAQDKYTLKVPNGLAFSEFRDTKTGRMSPSVRPKMGSR
jgi:hypothetical protein